MNDKHHQYYVGKVAEVAKRKGWFFGSFMDEPVLQSDLVEVAWQRIPNMTPNSGQKHFHKQAVEINVIISGWIQLTINGTQYKLEKGDCFIIWPETMIKSVTTGDDTELIVVKAPSLPNDKFAK